MKSANHVPKLWFQVATAWLTIALFDATQTLVTMRAMGMHHAWVTLFVVTTVTWAVWPMVTPAVFALLQRFRLPSKSVMHWIIHGVACITISLAWSTWAALLEHFTNPLANPNGPDEFADIWYPKFCGMLIVGFILYGAVVALNVALDTHNRLVRQQAASARISGLLAQAQLAMLRLQLEPHFVFNSLNAVTGLIREERGNDAIAVIAALGDLLRRVTDHSDRQYVVLEEEIAFLRKYLEIQQMRFAERLRYHIEIPDVLLGAQVPDFILQPLVENAIKHGIGKRAKGGALRIEAMRAGALLTLTVYNDGPLLPAHIDEGVGLANARQRLAALYGTEQTFELRNWNDTGVLATITLPYREH
ncbi:sensor histidine kinase [Undibacterium sp. Di27W]|uniref:sensor histidine kinase n=1 Tax=Undibacterium sp. Di27W TaxID=3413036 RepID=UPI003BF54472